MNASPDPVADPTMLDLFRSEMESLGTTLNNALLDLEESPDNARALGILKGAAHSVKGGAKIAELEDAVQLAHAMEDVFKAVEEGRHALAPTDIDVLLDATDLLIRMAETSGKEEAEGVSPDAAQARIAAVTAIPSGESAAPPPSAATSREVPERAGTPTTDRSSARERDAKRPWDGPPEEPSHEPSEPEPSAVDAGTDVPPPRTGTTAEGHGPAPRAVPAEPSREGRSSPPPPSLLDTFREEMDGWSDTLMESLDMLRDDPFDPAALPNLSATINALIGGARLVELANIVALAREMERCFDAADAHRLELTPEQIDRLVDAVDLLLRYTRSPDPETDPSVSPDALARVQTDIAAIADTATEPAAAHRETAEDKAKRSHRESPAAAAETAAPEPASALDNFGPAEANAPQRHAEAERTVRVTATKIERLMGLAGEVVVGARWLPPFSESLFQLKRGQSELANLLEDLQKVLETGDVHRAGKLAFQSRERLKGLGRDLVERMGELDMFTSVTANLSDRLYHEVIGVRMSPFAEGIRGYRRSLRDLARELDKRVRLEVVGESTEVDRDILERINTPLNHLLRNAVGHGIESPEKRRAAGKDETGTIRLEAAHRAGMLIITVADDGRGVDPDSIRHRLRERGIPGAESAERMSEPELLDYLFQPGFSTAPELTHLSGRGMGLNVVQAAVHEVGGMVRATSRPGEGTRFQMELPLALSVVRTFLVEIAGEPYAFPLARIDRCLRLAEAEIKTVEDRQYFMMDGQNVALVNVHEVLEIADPPPLIAPVNVVVVSDRDHAYGLVVDRFLGEFDLVVRPLDARLGKVPDISAAAVMLDGSPVLIFDVEDLVHSIDNLLSGTRRLRKIAPAEAVEEEAPPPRILVVEDSFIVREKERKLLENRGYQVEVAVDGMDGWNLVRTAPFDMVISDVDMPRMNGFELIRNIKRHAELSRLPVIIVSYKFTEEDRLEGLEAGADYYLSKTDFDDNTLIDAVIDLIGEP